MSKSKQWQQMRKHDTYYKQAKAHGYRSRSAYKLKEIQNKFKVFRASDVVLDLGAAPGGWSQVAAEIVGESGKIIGIDLETINPIENTILLVGDITDKNIIELIEEHLNNDRSGVKDVNGVNVVISDAAPNISGNYSIDQAKSVYLAEHALKLAEQLLVPKGNLVVKVFEGEDFRQFLDKIKSSFRKAKVFSPQASRTRSSEVYVIGIGYRK